MIKVAIDVSPLSGQGSFRGVGFYTRILLESLEEQKELRVIEFKDGKIPPEADLLHFPFFSPFSLSLPCTGKKKFVVTIHDLIPLIFPQHYPSGIKGKIKFAIQKARLKKVSMILTDSECSKKDIIKYLRFPSEKVEVVYLAAANRVKKISDKQRLEEISKKFNLPPKFVLYVGDVNYNKNLVTLVKACQKIKIKLAMVGKKLGERDFDRGHIENRPLVELNDLIAKGADVLKLGYVAEEELAALYSLASVYCQPSLYEGFGLQILEAFACGCPVVTSNISSLPEIAGDAAVLVDPYKIDSIAVGMKSIMEDRKLKDKMIQAGFKQAQKFSWAKTVAETIDIYKRCLGK